MSSHTIIPAHTNIYTDHFISGQRLFYQHTGHIANILSSRNIDEEKALEWAEVALAGRTLQTLSHSTWNQKAKRKRAAETFFLLHDNILLNIDRSYGVTIYHTRESEASAAALMAELQRFCERSQRGKPEYEVVVAGSHGAQLTSLECSRPKAALAITHNDDLVALHPALLKELKRTEGCGLHLLYSAPGTGKSTYLRHLIAGVRSKRFIFLSPKLAGNLDTPDLLRLLISHPSSILVIEDAEELLVSRDAGRNSAMSFLLNLTDGLLGESLHIQVICTFNTGITALDKALLRKGRLKTLYEFKPLAAGKAQALAQSISGKAQPAKPQTLAEIYYGEAEDFRVLLEQDMKLIISFKHEEVD